MIASTSSAAASSSRARSRSMEHYFSPARRSSIAVNNWLNNAASSALHPTTTARSGPTNHRRRASSSFTIRCGVRSSFVLDDGKIPSTPSPVCSPPPSHHHHDDGSAPQDLESSCSALDGLDPQPRRSPPPKLMLCDDEKDDSIGTTNYYADDDDLRLQAISEQEEEEPEPITANARYHHAQSSSSGSYSGCDDEEIESVMEERIRKSVQARRLLRAYCDDEESRRMKQAAKMSRWKEAFKMKILTQLKREEAAIDRWEKKKINQARMEMKELEMKLDSKRTQAMERMETKIIHAHKEAKKKRIKERTTANRRIVEVTQGFDKAAAMGKLPCWLSFHLKAC